MPDLRICKNSGGIVFRQTPEERKQDNIQQELRKELSEVRELRKQLEAVLSKVAKEE